MFVPILGDLSAKSPECVKATLHVAAAQYD